MRDAGNRVIDAVHIVQSEADPCARLVASGLFAGASGKEADGVGAPLGKDGLNGMAEAGAIGQQQHHRGNTPGHANHGDGGAATVVEHRLPSLAEYVFEHVATPGF